MDTYPTHYLYSFRNQFGALLTVLRSALYLEVISGRGELADSDPAWAGRRLGHALRETMEAYDEACKTYELAAVGDRAITAYEAIEPQRLSRNGAYPVAVAVADIVRAPRPCVDCGADIHYDPADDEANLCAGCAGEG
jgi:hypothetical protein